MEGENKNRGRRIDDRWRSLLKIYLPWVLTPRIQFGLSATLSRASPWAVSQTVSLVSRREQRDNNFNVYVYYSPTVRLHRYRSIGSLDGSSFASRDTRPPIDAPNFYDPADRERKRRKLPSCRKTSFLRAKVATRRFVCPRRKSSVSRISKGYFTRARFNEHG